MEGKLYFEPESSGKKKHKRKRMKYHRFLILFFFLLFILIVILILIWLLRGSKTISGQYPENVKSESLECVKDDIQYNKIDEVKPDNSQLQISMIFRGHQELSSIYLKYFLAFSDDVEAYSADAIANAQFNVGLSARGFDAGKFNNKFTLMDNTLTVTLHASPSEIDEYTKDYFLIDSETLSSVNEYKDNYEKQGFSCSEKE